MQHKYYSFQFYSKTWSANPALELLDVIQYDEDSGHYTILADVIDINARVRKLEGASGVHVLRNGDWVVKDFDGPVMVFSERKFRVWQKSQKED